MNACALLSALIDARLFGLADRESDVLSQLRALGVNVCFASEIEAKP